MEDLREYLPEASDIPQPTSEEFSHLTGMVPGAILHIKSNDASLQLQGAVVMKEYLRFSNSEAIDTIIRYEGLAPLIACLSHTDPDILLEVSWAISNLAAGSTLQTKALKEAGAVDPLVKLLKSADTRPEVIENVMLALGNIASDCLEYKLLVVRDHNVLPFTNQRMLEMLNSTTPMRLSRLRNASWAFSSMYHRDRSFNIFPPPDHFPTFAKLLSHSDSEIIRTACSCLDKCKEEFDISVYEILDGYILPRLVELLSHPDYMVVKAALPIVGNLCSGDGDLTQAVINAGAISPLGALVGKEEPGEDISIVDLNKLRKEALWAISNICAGSEDQMQAVIDASVRIEATSESQPLLEMILRVLNECPYSAIQNEAAYVWLNLLDGASHSQRRYVLATYSALGPLVYFAYNAPRGHPKLLNQTLDVCDQALMFVSVLADIWDNYEESKADLAVAASIIEKYGRSKVDPALDPEETGKPGEGDTALRVALVRRLERVCRVLVVISADINKVDNTSSSDGFLSRRTAPSLLVEGAKNGSSILHAVCLMHDSVTIAPSILKTLLDVEGIEVNIRDNDGKTPLHYAVHNIYNLYYCSYAVDAEKSSFWISADILALLVRKGADVCLCDEFGFTALDLWDLRRGNGEGDEGDAPDSIQFLRYCHNMAITMTALTCAASVQEPSMMEPSSTGRGSSTADCDDAVLKRFMVEVSPVALVTAWQEVLSIFHPL